MFIKIVFLISIMFAAISCGGADINNSGTGAASASAEVESIPPSYIDSESGEADSEKSISETKIEIETADNVSKEDTTKEDTATVLSTTNVDGQTLQVIQLPDPKAQFAKYNNISLLSALENRHSARDFANVPLEIGEISALLWAAGGINRESGRLTVPTSSNTQDMLIYIIKEDGVWLYNPVEHTIEQKSAKDVRQTLEPAVARGAAATIYYVQNMEKASNERAGDRHAGSMYQNVGLFCAVANLNNVVTGSFNRNAGIEQTLQIPANHRAIIAQSVGKRP